MVLTVSNVFERVRFSCGWPVCYLLSALCSQPPLGGSSNLWFLTLLIIIYFTTMAMAVPYRQKGLEGWSNAWMAVIHSLLKWKKEIFILLMGQIRPRCGTREGEADGYFISNNRFVIRNPDRAWADSVSVS